MKKTDGSEKKRVGIIGCGNMGSAMARQLVSQYSIMIFDKDEAKIRQLPKGVIVAGNSVELIKKNDVIILAVKPQDFPDILKEIKEYIAGRLLITIAAGITTKYIEDKLGNVAVLRAMPNIGLKIGESVTCLAGGAFLTAEGFSFGEELFYYLGTTKQISESMMNAATAISGSGPAYIFDFMGSSQILPHDLPDHARHDLIRRLEKAAEGVGFSSEDATFLAVNTVNSSLSVMKKINIPAGEFIKQVASKGGTTEAALEVLRTTDSWEDAAKAALARAEELSKKG